MATKLDEVFDDAAALRLALWITAFAQGKAGLVITRSNALDGGTTWDVRLGPTDDDAPGPGRSML